MVHIKFAKLKETATIPTKRKEDAGYDIYACFDESHIILKPNETVKIGTGLASSIPIGYCFILKERGSTGSIGIGQRSGVIDSGYRNEWLIPLTNHNAKPILLLKKEFKSTEEYRQLVMDMEYIEYSYERAISQALLIAVPESDVAETSYEELLEDKSERMLEAFGSTNKD